MKPLLSKLYAFILSFFKKSPEPITLRHQFITLQKQAEELDNIAFWFSCNPENQTTEITQQLENASSRVSALTSAVLIKIRSDEEIEQVRRIMERKDK